MVTRQLQTWINCIMSSMVTLFPATVPQCELVQTNLCPFFVIVLLSISHQRTNHRKQVSLLTILTFAMCKRLEEGAKLPS